MTSTQTVDTATLPAQERRPANWGDIAVTFARALASADFPPRRPGRTAAHGPGRAGCRCRLASAGEV